MLAATTYMHYKHNTLLQPLTLNRALKPSSLTVRTKQSTMPRYTTTLPWSLCSSRAPCQPDTCNNNFPFAS